MSRNRSCFIVRLILGLAVDEDDFRGFYLKAELMMMRWIVVVSRKVLLLVIIPAAVLPEAGLIGTPTRHPASPPEQPKVGPGPLLPSTHP